jgi:hypothetical protein
LRAEKGGKEREKDARNDDFKAKNSEKTIEIGTKLQHFILNENQIMLLVNQCIKMRSQHNNGMIIK